MGIRKMAATATVALVTVAMLATPAFALVRSTGKTNEHAALRVTARENLSGRLSYASRSGFAAICAGFTKYKTLAPHAGMNRVRLMARCTSSTGKRVWLKAVLIDYRHSSRRDVARILWKTHKATPWSHAQVRDVGKLAAGYLRIR